MALLFKDVKKTFPNLNRESLFVIETALCTGSDLVSSAAYQSQLFSVYTLRRCLQDRSE